VAEKVAEAAGKPTADLIGDADAVRGVDLDALLDENIGKQTLADIRRELIRPWRDPRPRFKAPRFLDHVDKLEDIQVGVETDGVVTNVTDFGAFIDVGIEQDGLVHLSEMANRYVKDPNAIVKVGDIVRVKVIKVDQDSKRLSLSMRALLPPPKPRRKARPEPAADASSQAGEQAAAPRDAQPRPARDRPGGDRDGAQDRRGERPPRRAEARPPADRDDRRRGPGGGTKASRKARQVKPVKVAGQHDRSKKKGGSDDKNFNTSLADQLASLKEKFEGDSE